MSTISNWLKAARLRTLPLAFASTGMGNLLAFSGSDFSIPICLMSLTTTLFLQVLSNFANDYGDSIHGADGKDRKGPQRAVQSGLISSSAMKTAILLLAGLSLVSGLLLLWLSFHSNWALLLPVLAIGLLSIAAAYYYTNGSKPYGYQAMGDVSVFLFFGLVGVLVTKYLHTQSFQWIDFLPACSLGFWSTAVLNINNMRDMESDLNASKLTIPIHLGLEKAKMYQSILVLGGAFALFLYGWTTSSALVLGSVPGILFMLRALRSVWKTEVHTELDAFLKPQALGTFAAVAGMAVWKALV